MTGLTFELRHYNCTYSLMNNLIKCDCTIAKWRHVSPLGVKCNNWITTRVTKSTENRCRERPSPVTWSTCAGQAQ